MSGRRTGLAPTNVKKLRLLFARHQGWKPGMRCTTLLALEADPLDPALAFPTRALRTYIEIWLREKDFRADLGEIWPKLRQAALKAGEGLMWRDVFGPVASAICTLLNAKWKPEEERGGELG